MGCHGDVTVSDKSIDNSIDFPRMQASSDEMLLESLLISSDWRCSSLVDCYLPSD